MWPVRPRPREDELLSSWLQELARSHGQKLQAFCDCVFGNNHQIWNRDIDRLAPSWLLDALAQGSGVPHRAIMATTFSDYKGTLYRKQRTSGQLRWILPLQMYHRKHLGFGMQYCSRCLASDKEPYFRRRWRVAYYTFCPHHHCLLRDRCWQCSATVAFHRRELGKPKVLSTGPMSICHSCGYDLRLAPRLRIPTYDREAHQETVRLLKSLESNHQNVSQFDLDFHGILHQQCRLIVSERSAPRYKHFIRQQIQCPQLQFVTGRFPFENRPLEERHHVVAMAMWMMSDLEKRVTLAWKERAVRYNVLLKDMDLPPQDFANFLRGFNRNCTSRKKSPEESSHSESSKRIR
jgi:hypothetical protein